MSDLGCVTLSKTRQSHAVRFPFMPMGHEVTGLKTYRGPKRKEQLGALTPSENASSKQLDWRLGRQAAQIVTKGKVHQSSQGPLTAYRNEVAGVAPVLEKVVGAPGLEPGTR
jgi:hypothetical protein